MHGDDTQVVQCIHACRMGLDIKILQPLHRELQPSEIPAEAGSPFPLSP